jgi:hypothetical protein
MRGLWNIRWLCFLSWLEIGAPGVLPRVVQATLGAVGAHLPLARHVARSVDSWLLALCQQRQQGGRPLLALNGDEWAAALRQDILVRPFEPAQIQRHHAWLGWRLEAEFLRLVRLLEGPEDAMQRVGWLSCEVRYWALVATLIRLGQVYQALAAWQGEEQAQHSYRLAAARVWQRAIRGDQAA